MIPSVAVVAVVAVDVYLEILQDLSQYTEIRRLGRLR